MPSSSTFSCSLCCTFPYPTSLNARSFSHITSCTTSCTEMTCLQLPGLWVCGTSVYSDVAPLKALNGKIIELLFLMTQH